MALPEPRPASSFHALRILRQTSRRSCRPQSIATSNPSDGNASVWLKDIEDNVPLSELKQCPKTISYASDR